jgi:O-antigen/teichoic acid export membrane protein
MGRVTIRFLGKNILIYSLGSVALRFASVVLIPIYTRRLSVESYGLLDICLIMI